MPELSPPASPNGRTPPPTQPDALAALARQVDRLQQAITAADVPALREDVRALDVTVAGVAEQVAELVETGAGKERPAPSWLWPAAVDDPALAVSVAEQLLAGLVEWLSRVYVQFDDARLPDCWLWHPAVVEELVWLWKAWRGAYRGSAATVQRAGDWHDRQRPGVVRRIRDAAGSCSLREHLQPSAEPTVPIADAVSAVAAWRAVPGQPAPVPTDEQVRAADAAICSGGGWR
jgi:hypothetical protein